MLPLSISFANSLLSTFWESGASWVRTPMDVLFSEDAWETRKTLMPLSANAVKIRLFTPITPTMPSPCMVIRAVSLIDEMPLIIFPLGVGFILRISVPSEAGLKVFFTRIGMLLW